MFNFRCNTVMLTLSANMKELYSKDSPSGWTGIRVKSKKNNILKFIVFQADFPTCGGLNLKIEPYW